MATVARFSPIASVSANDYYPAWKFNTQVRNNLNFIVEKPRVQLYRSEGTPTLEDDTWSTVAFYQETFDTDGLHFTSQDDVSRIYLARPGLWMIEAHVKFDESVRGKVRLRINGAVTLAANDTQIDSGGPNTPVDVVSIHRTTDGSDFVEVQVRPDSPAKLEGTVELCSFRAVWLGNDPASVTTWTAPTTASTGSYTSSKFNTQVRANIYHLYGRPACAVYHNTDQSISSGTTPGAASFNAETFDTEALHDTSTNNSRITLKRVGLWLVTGNAVFPHNVTGQRGVRLRVNATTVIGGVLRDAWSPATASGNQPNWVGHVAGLYYTSTTTDYVELEVRQDSGGALDLVGGTVEATHMRAVWMGG